MKSTAITVDQRPPLQMPKATTPLSIPMNECPYRWLGGLMLLVTFVVFGGWATFAPLSSSVVATGKIIVSSQNKQLQHLDGGIVREIYVQDGAEVKEGQPLLLLDDTQLQAQLDNVQGQLWETEASLKRLVAERDGKAKLKIEIKTDKSTDSQVLANIVQTQQELFSAKRQAFLSEKQVFQQRLAQSKEQIGGLKQELKTLRKRHNSLGKDIDSLRKLASREMVAKSTLRQSERDYDEIGGDIARNTAEQSRLNEVIAETNHQVILKQEEYLKEISAEMSSLQAKQVQLKAQKSAIEDKLSRLLLVSPVDGRVNGFELVTQGAVVGAGQLIMDVVPIEQAFKIIAEVNPNDIDVLGAGQKAEVRFSLFENARYFPVITAEVIDVSADTLQNEKNGNAYYKATLLISDKGLNILQNEGEVLVAGMPVDVFVKTGQRTLLDYLIEPFTDIAARAFNEE